MDVSVLMPVYNGERYLAQAIESILGQTHRHFEFVIVNDGSTDRTEEILDRYAARDSRIRVFRQDNQGQSAALNRGLELAKHDWVAIIDHDDISLPRRLELQIEAVARSPEVRVLGTCAYHINAAGKRLRQFCGGPATVEEFESLQTKGRRVKLFHASVLMHRPTILSLGGYDPAFGPCSDSDLWTRVAEHHVVLAIPDALVLYRVHRDSMSFRQMSEQRELSAWIDARQVARHADRPLPTLEEYRDSCRHGFGLKRWRHLRHRWFWHNRTRWAIALADEKRLPAAVFGACAAIAAPKKAIGVVRQWLSS
jgi:glycosyltransferase involved in cell wall biosynthesis